MKKKKSTGLKFELTGGVYIIEEFSDGTEKRTELPGDLILNIVLQIVEAHTKVVIKEAKKKRVKS